MRMGMAAHTRTGTNMHMGEAKIPRYLYGQPICVRAAHMRTGSPYAYGQPICVRAAHMCTGSPYAYESINIAHTRIGCPYAYGIAHTHMGKICIWDGTELNNNIFYFVSIQGRRKKFWFDPAEDLEISSKRVGKCIHKLAHSCV